MRLTRTVGKTLLLREEAPHLRRSINPGQGRPDVPARSLPYTGASARDGMEETV